MSESTSPPTNYWDYIKVEELLGLQSGLATSEDDLADDEVVFIVVHQVYELWFKLVLREMRSLRDVFKREHVEEQALSEAVHGIERVVTILRRCADHFEVVETLTTRDYLGFRDKLTPASGFQSAQLRQIEILMGLRDDERIPLGFEGDYKEMLRAHDGSDSPALRRVEAQEADMPSVAGAVSEWLFRTPIDGVAADAPDAAAALERFIQAYTDAHAGEVDRSAELALARAFTERDRGRVAARLEAEKAALTDFLHPDEAAGGEHRRRIRAAMLFVLSYRELPLLAWPRQLLDGLIHLEQVFVVFRQRHARMVERVIGRRTGTGGSAGVEYLDNTALSYRVFRDLWAVRTFQVRQEAAPPLESAAFYGFKNG